MQTALTAGMKARPGSPAAVLSRSKMKAMNATAALEMSALKRKKARSDRGVSVAAASKVADLAYKRNSARWALSSSGQ